MPLPLLPPSIALSSGSLFLPSLFVSHNPRFQQSTAPIVSTTMYPKVKVRIDSQDDHQPHWSSLLSLKDIHFLSLQDSCFPVKGHKDPCPSPVARVPKNYVPNIVIPYASEGVEIKSNSNSDEEDRPNFKASDEKEMEEDGPNIKASNEKEMEEDRPNIRASSVPRPRAVLSSPDNDAMIGSKNKIKTVRPSPLKNHNFTQNRHVQCKAITRHDTDETPVKTRKSKDATDNRCSSRGKKEPVQATTGQRRNVTTTKASSERIWL